jgi:phosphonate C-P lyase system protein PhnG
LRFTATVNRRKSFRLQTTGDVTMEMQLIIASLDEEAVVELEGLLPMGKMTISRPAETGLLMATARDAFETDFYLGEMLATEVEVAYEGADGYALLAGADGRRAVLAAAVDAVMQKADGQLSRRVADFLDGEAEKTVAGQAAERMMIAATRVDFETMNPG